ncbi:MAG: hypothetical protein RL211_358 [Pseudomonadota bacterium]|jgi:hypothetical protein
MTHPTKLTLRLDSGLIESAKAFAQVHQRSLSQLVADYFARLAAQSVSAAPTGAKASKAAALAGSSAGKKPAELSSVTASLRGVLKAKSAPKISAKHQPSTDPDKAAYHKYLEEKYL